SNASCGSVASTGTARSTTSVQVFSPATAPAAWGTNPHLLYELNGMTTTTSNKTCNASTGTAGSQQQSPACGCNPMPGGAEGSCAGVNNTSSFSSTGTGNNRNSNVLVSGTSMRSRTGSMASSNGGRNSMIAG
ncbi:unnamed protein product, partial [Amoebophrya sp. A25]